MTFCREFHCLPEPGGYLDQPADVMVQWGQMLAAEREGQEMARKIEQARAKAKQN